MGPAVTVMVLHDTSQQEELCRSHFGKNLPKVTGNDASSGTMTVCSQLETERLVWADRKGLACCVNTSQAQNDIQLSVRIVSPA